MAETCLKNAKADSADYKGMLPLDAAPKITFLSTPSVQIR